MRRVKDTSKKGKRIEKEFVLCLNRCYPACLTETKPRVISLTKDFWRLFDGLTFHPIKRRYIFWQVKGKRVSMNERRQFFKQAQVFGNSFVKIVLVERNGKDFELFVSETERISIRHLFRV
jgi:hypothetical protein